MAKKARCKTVDAMIRSMWARMAYNVAKNAIDEAANGEEDVAEASALWAEKFYDRAGGRAVGRYYSWR